MKTICVLEKRQWNWKPKDKEERTVPIPDSLVELLKVRKAMGGSRSYRVCAHGIVPIAQ
jgi:integrase